MKLQFNRNSQTRPQLETALEATHKKIRVMTQNI